MVGMTEEMNLRKSTMYLRAAAAQHLRLPLMPDTQIWAWPLSIQLAPLLMPYWLLHRPRLQDLQVPRR